VVSRVAALMTRMVARAMTIVGAAIWSRSAPAAAPASIASIEPSRRWGRAPGPDARALSAASPVRVSVSTVVVRSAAAMRRTVAFCRPKLAASAAVVAIARSPM
jgi:hypothetical protein